MSECAVNTCARVYLQKGYGYNAMGMAASQARFLGLTARKNNVEFEGQQINQQRTALANQSANYYNDLLGMAVPVPPSVDSYTKTVYSFNDGALTNEITALIAQTNGLYKVSYLQQWEDDFSVVSAATSIINRSVDLSGAHYLVGADEIEQIYDQTTLAAEMATLGYTDPTDKEQIGQFLKAVRPGNEYAQSLSDAEAGNLALEEIEYLSLLEDRGNVGDTWGVRYIENMSDGTWKPYFYNITQLTPPSTIYDSSTGNSQSAVKCYTMGNTTRTQEVKGEFSRVEQDATGRYINITIYKTEADAAADRNGVQYSLTTSTITDQGAYEDAMNQYEFDKAQYDQAIQEINSKIEIIQAEDKNLELRLKQLDTEQDAISTEMDAVQKVIEKNTENSFKTFG